MFNLTITVQLVHKLFFTHVALSIMPLMYFRFCCFVALVQFHAYEKNYYYKVTSRYCTESTNSSYSGNSVGSSNSSVAIYLPLPGGNLNLKALLNFFVTFFKRLEVFVLQHKRNMVLHYES